MKRFSLFSLAGLLLFSIIFLPPAFSQTTNETLTITTYYPSPYGVYNELRLYPKPALLPGDCGGLNEGTMYYDNTNNRLMVCAETGFGIYGWQSTSSLWALSSSGTNLYPNNTTWNVGIGTSAPSTRLHIAGPASGAIRIEDGNQAAGRVLTSDASGVGTWQAPGGGGMSNIGVYSTPGSFSFSVPAGVTRLWVEVYGGGGAGGGSTNNPYVAGGGGGGAGGVAMGFVAVTPGQSITVTVGAGGINGCSYSGGYGGASSFATLSATGGEGGSAGSQNYNWGGRGGQGSGGSINLKGGAGDYGIQFDTGSAGEWTNSIGSIGGSNAKGGGGGPVGADYNGGAFGGGGGGHSSGCCMSCYYGGWGGTGGVIIWY